MWIWSRLQQRAMATLALIWPPSALKQLGSRFVRKWTSSIDLEEDQMQM